MVSAAAHPCRGPAVRICETDTGTPRVLISAGEGRTQRAEQAPLARYLPKTSGTLLGGLRRDRAARRQLIDRRRQGVRQLRCQLLRVEAGLGCQLAEHAAAEHLADLRWRDRLVRSVCDPRARDAAEPLLLELRDDALNAAVLLNQRIDHRDHLCAHGAAQQSI